LATAAYLALPPAMWAVWSTKARGGYAEVLFLGEALLLATLALARAPTRLLALLWGLLGLAFWTHRPSSTAAGRPPTAPGWRRPA
jgi:hypothetical protein